MPEYEQLFHLGGGYVDTGYTSLSTFILENFMLKCWEKFPRYGPFLLALPLVAVIYAHEILPGALGSLFTLGQKCLSLET